jgi:methionyl-tRNA formyltransferase
MPPRTVARSSNRPRLRAVIASAVELGIASLEALIGSGAAVVGVLGLDRSRASFNSDYRDLAAVAEADGLPALRVTDINASTTVAQLRAWSPDVMFVVGWPQLVRRETRDVPRLGSIGAHPTLLPEHRGRHPLIWALVEGRTRGGLTFFRLDDGADSGDIVWQRPFDIGILDDAGDLYDRVEALERVAIAELVPALESGTLTAAPQDAARASYRRKRSEADGAIDWSAPTVVSYNLVRALARPYPGAHTYHRGHKVVVLRSALPTSAPPAAALDTVAGTVITAVDGELHVRTGDGYLRLIEVDTGDGTAIEIGDRLGDRHL